MINTRRLVFGAVLAFAVGWGTLAILAQSGSQRTVSPDDPASSSSRRLSREEIARHDQPDDCWLVIRGRVYDVTPYISSHPAPRRTITDYCGTDSTRAFETKEIGRPHSPRARQLLESFFVGEASE